MNLYLQDVYIKLLSASRILNEAKERVKIYTSHLESRQKEYDDLLAAFNFLHKEFPATEEELLEIENRN